MRWGRALVVAVMAMVAMALPFAVAAPEVRAAPVDGVVFASPVRIFDSLLSQPLTPSTFPIGVAAPSGSTTGLIQLAIVEPTTGPSGVLMVHRCDVAPDPASDAVLPIEPSGAVMVNQVYVPLSAAGVCVTMTAGASRLAVDSLGGVVPGNGAAYVDVPFTHVTTIIGPATGQRLDFSAAGIPSDVNGLALWLDAVSPTAGYASLYPCGVPTPFAQANWSDNEPSTTLIAGVAASPTAGVCINILGSATVDISVDGYYKVGATPTQTSPPQVRWSQEPAPGFVGTAPQRLFDTRTAGTPIAAGQSYRLDLSPYVPADTTAVVMNVTADQTSAAGFVTAYPCDGTQPDTSSLNFEAHQTVPNLVTVDAGTSLEVCFFASVSTHLLADLAGYYMAGGGDGFAPSAPVRMLDTRGMASPIAGPAKVGGHTVFDFDVSSFIAADATAVVFNLTATDVRNPGFVTAYPCGQQPPNASNLNVLPGQTVPNLVTVALGANKHVCFFTTANINLIADLAGWYSPSATSGFVSILPTRWADTRDSADEPVPAGSVFFIDFRQDFPEANAMAFNATATEPTAAGYLTAFPCGPEVPNASNVNFVAGQSVPNMAISAIDELGRLCMFNSASTQWIVDVSGYFTDAPVFFTFFPDGTDNV